MNKIDSLSLRLEEPLPDSTRIKTLIELAFELGFSDTKRGLKVAWEANRLAEKSRSGEGVANAHSLLGRIYYDMGIMDSSMYHYLEALQFYEYHPNKKVSLEIFRGISQIHKELKNYDQSEVYIHKAQDIAEKLEWDKEIGNTYNDLGAVTISRAMDQWTNWKDSVRQSELYEQSLPYFEKAIGYFQKAGYERGIALCNGNIAIIKSHLGLIQESLDYSLLALEYFKKNNYKLFMTISYFQIAESYNKMKRYDEALAASKMSLQLAEEMESKIDISNGYKSLAYSYANLGQYDKAYDYQKLHTVLETQLRNEEAQEKIDQLEADYEQLKNERKIAQLRKASSKQQSLIDRQGMFLVVALLLIMAIAVIATLSYRSYRLKLKANRQLELQKQQITSQHNALAQNALIISRQKEQISDQHQKLKEMFDAQKALVTMLTHDLKAPFDQIKGLANILEITGPLNEEQGQIRDKMDLVANRGREIIQDLNKINELEEELYSMKPEPIQVNHLVERVLETHLPHAESKQIEVVYEATEEELILNTDKESLRRIMDNLISNAIKYSPFKKHIFISAFKREAQVFIKVADEGPGFSHTDKEKLFNKFQRLSNQPTGGETSSGLGLSIVKALVDKLNGTITVESEIGNGAEFLIGLPPLEA